jgi:hypothetical protein
MRAFRAALVVLSACATLADGEPGLDATPSANAGPFRLLEPGEIGQGRVAPNVIDDAMLALADLSVVSDGPDSLSVSGFGSAKLSDEASGSVPGIARVRAVDGRSFERTAEPVLRAREPWEGTFVSSPSAARDADGALWLAYEAAGGIGLTREENAGTFDNATEPFLSSLELGSDEQPREPGLVFLPDGSLRLFYSLRLADGRVGVGVASSPDGREVSDHGLVLVNDEPGSVLFSPEAVVGVSAQGREILYLYFATRVGNSRQEIGMAARFLDGSKEDLERSEVVVYRPKADVDVRQPCVVRWPDYSMLFATQDASAGSSAPVVVAGLAPADALLPVASPP